MFWVRLGNSESLGFHLCSDPLQKGLQPSAAVQALVATHGSHAKGQDVHVERQQTQIWKTWHKQIGGQIVHFVFSFLA